MNIRKLSMLAACFGLVGACWGCDDSSNDVSGKDTVVCDAGSLQCSGTTLQECADNAWTTLKECEHGCDADKKECKTEDDPQPPEDEKVCTKNECKEGENILKICAEDGMSFSEEKPCEEGEKCEDGACVPEGGEVVCEAGKKECDAEKGKNAYRECVDNAWVDKTCEGEQVCSEGECVAPPSNDNCTAESKKCSDDKKGYVVCTSEGKWGTDVTPCGEKEVCDAEQNKCVEEVAPECQNDQTKCADDKSYFKCVDGKWATEKTACADGKVCDSVSNSCEEKCTDNTARCSADYKEILKCTDGAWVSSKKCNGNQLCIDSECKDTVCTPKQDICAGVPGKKDKYAMYHCTDKGQLGELVEAETYCAGECTADKTACLVCKEGALNCTDKGVFQICQKNAWVDIVNCGENKCSKDKLSAGCKCQVKEGMKNADLRCNADASKTEICSSLKDGEQKYKGWVEHQDCAGKDKCETKDNKTVCKCGDDAFSCNENVLQLCNNGVLEDKIVCTDKETCDAKDKACVCKDGDRTCDGDNAKKCVSGEWIPEKCKNNETCSETLGGICVTKEASLCNDKDPAKCYNNLIVKCKGGLYDITEVCPVECITSNNGAKCADACVKDTQACSSDYKAIVTCSSEQVATTENCKTDERCLEKKDGNKVTASCVKKECEEMTLVCDGTKVSLCQNNEKKAVLDCATYNLVCKDGACAAKN
ncbi:MAG: hypothetical protein J6A01_05285 [Proteobacteria bacterium]|nr:hypothetical protein [Pseudomonadota bacterium]